LLIHSSTLTALSQWQFILACIKRKKLSTEHISVLQGWHYKFLWQGFSIAGKDLLEQTLSSSKT